MTTKNQNMGRPLKMSNGRNIIFETLKFLPQDGSPIRFKDLRVIASKASMSSATLSKALFYLTTSDQVLKSEVPSNRGKGVTYQLVPDVTYFGVTGKPFNIISILTYFRKILLDHKEASKTSEDELKRFELQHSGALCGEVQIISYLLLCALKFYAEDDKNKKEGALESYTYLINGLIKEISKTLIDDIGMTNNTFLMCCKAVENMKVD